MRSRNHDKCRRSRKLQWQILQELADAEFDACKLSDQNREAFCVLQRELDSPLQPDIEQMRKEAESDAFEN